MARWSQLLNLHRPLHCHFTAALFMVATMCIILSVRGSGSRCRLRGTCTPVNRVRLPREGVLSRVTTEMSLQDTMLRTLRAKSRMGLPRTGGLWSDTALPCSRGRLSHSVVGECAVCAVLGVCRKEALCGQHWNLSCNAWRLAQLSHCT